MRFEDLNVWKRAARLGVELCCNLAESREYGFKDQITRSALSIASNIAEGYERDSGRDRIRFLQYAKGSCGELRTQLFIGIEADYLDREQGREWIAETREISAMLYSLIRYFREHNPAPNS